MESIISLIRSNQLTSYFVLAYGISWSWILAILASKRFCLDAIATQDTILIFLMILLGPSTSTIILSAVLGGRADLLDLWKHIMR